MTDTDQNIAGPDVGHGPSMGDSGPLLPTGVHPRDMAVTGEAVALATDSPVGPDTPDQLWSPGRKGFPTDNREAVGVFQRCSEFWSARVVVVDANAGGTAEVAGRQRGRSSIKIWVPTTLPNGTTPAGVIIAPTQGEVQAGGNSGVVLNAGDSITLRTEAPVFAGLLGNNSTGYCQCVVEFDPPTPVSVSY
jgi:hypothetical protein